MPRAFAPLLLLALPAAAETRSGLVLRPFAGDRPAEIAVEIDQYLRSETDRGLDYQMRVFGTKGRVRLIPEAKRGSPVFGWDLLFLDTQTPDPRIPGKLTEASVAGGAGMRAGEWILQGTLGAGFAGDRPFSGRGWYGLASVSGTRILGPGNVFTIGLDFDGNRPVFPDVPLPVLLWTRVWNDSITTSIGFPFLAIAWKPRTWLEVGFRGIPGVFQTGAITVRPSGSWDLFVRYRSANFRFFIDEFSRDDDRLFYGESRVEVGCTWRPDEGTELTLFAGWAFDRAYRTGFDVRDTDTLARIDDAAVFGLSFTIRF